MNDLAQIYSDSNPPGLQERLGAQIPQTMRNAMDLQASQHQSAQDEVSEFVSILKKKYPHLSEQALYLMASGIISQRMNIANQQKHQQQSSDFQKKMTY